VSNTEILSLLERGNVPAQWADMDQQASQIRGDRLRNGFMTTRLLSVGEPRGVRYGSPREFSFSVEDIPAEVSSLTVKIVVTGPGNPENPLYEVEKLTDWATYRAPPGLADQPGRYRWWVEISREEHPDLAGELRYESASFRVERVEELEAVEAIPSTGRDRADRLLRAAVLVNCGAGHDALRELDFESTQRDVLDLRDSLRAQAALLLFDLKGYHEARDAVGGRLGHPPSETSSHVPNPGSPRD
jgi:hypothetical protein